MKLVNVNAVERATVMMVEVRVHNVTMDRDSFMISLKNSNNASVDILDSSFESIKGN